MEDTHGQDSLTAVPQLPVAIIVCILELLPANERALTGRLVCHDAWKALSGPEHCTASLAQPLPPHATVWDQEAGQQYMRQLSFRNKWQLLCTAAISGSEVNLEVAWALLQPSLFPGLHSNYYLAPDCEAPQPGLAAVQAGHPQLLRWFLDRCPRVLDLKPILVAAAKYCDLAGLQAAWHVLPCFHGDSSGDRLPLGQDVLDAAAQSATRDGLAKMQWVLEGGRGACKLTEDMAEYAARNSNVAGLRWLRDRGCRMTRTVLEAALQYGSRKVFRWVNMNAHSWMLPSAGGCKWHGMFRAAANSSDDWEARMQWVEWQGGRLEDCTSSIHSEVTYSSISELVPNVALSLLVPWPSASWAQAQPVLAAAAAASGSIQLAQRARSAGVAFTSRALFTAAEQSDLAMLRWLVQEAGVPVGGLDLGDVISPWRGETAAGLRDLLQAVQLLVGAGCRRVGPTGLSAAARKGDLRLVQYLHAELGCEVTGEAVGAAVEGGCEALVEWMWEHQLDGTPPTVSYFKLALDGDLAMLSTLRRLGAPFGEGDELVRAAYEGVRQPVLEWLAENGAPLGSTDGIPRFFRTRRLWKNPNLPAVGRWLQDLAASQQQRGEAHMQRLQQLPLPSAASGGAGPSGLFGSGGVQRAAGEGGEAKQERPEAQGEPPCQVVPIALRATRSQTAHAASAAACGPPAGGQDTVASGATAGAEAATAAEAAGKGSKRAGGGGDGGSGSSTAVMGPEEGSAVGPSLAATAGPAAWGVTLPVAAGGEGAGPSAQDLRSTLGERPRPAPAPAPPAATATATTAAANTAAAGTAFTAAAADAAAAAAATAASSNGAAPAAPSAAGPQQQQQQWRRVEELEAQLRASVQAASPGTASGGGEPRPDPQAALERGEDEATLALQQQQQAVGDGAGAGVAQAHQQPQPQEPVPWGGEDDAGPSGAVGPSGARGFRGAAEEGWPALGEEQEQPVPQGGALCSSDADGAPSEGGGGSVAPGAIDDPDWYADTFPNRFLDSVMEHQERIKAAAAEKLVQERKRAAAAEERAEAAEEQLVQERGRAERERGRAEAAEAESSELQQQLARVREQLAREQAERERERAEAAAGMAALQEQLRQLQGAGGSAGLPGQGAEGGRQRLRRQRRQQQP